MEKTGKSLDCRASTGIGVGIFLRWLVLVDFGARTEI